ncbi:MAG: vitamin B12-dependent ribonucleotide reductase [Verrucomicrobia bacterium]|nr:vitamin B12-dependent ribonucleotide reductase [Verrucomicrobiota bacterium]MCH8513064.1 vitamin B12-dependent ribonucleotide reductase [Kiritimatiellia bacterium]
MSQFTEAQTEPHSETKSNATDSTFIKKEVKEDMTGGEGWKVPRTFSEQGTHPFDQLKWARRTATIHDDGGGVLFEQKDVEVPATWSMLATNVVASKYFYGKVGEPNRENSLKQLIHRVTRTIADWGLADGYFASDADAETFYEELTWLCVNQHGAFNSPVWFNCGLFHEYGAGEDSGEGSFFWDPNARTIRRAQTQYEYPQCSACFIQSVDDTMDSIMALAQSEAMLFKFGSGTGTDLSPIRSSRENMSGGGTPSGPLSFLRVYDAVASVVKSGGKTRRAAKMNTLKVHHPDILEFIQAKTKEEKKAWALIEQGYSGDFNGEAYGSVAFQNENLSVRVTDAFMQAAMEDGDWTTTWVTDPSKAGPTYKAREILNGIAEGTWVCGDPGIQYEDTIQAWHTCSGSGPINASNPCSEYMFLDDTACNLASLNLMKFMEKDGTFAIERFRAAVDIFITAQEIIVDRASYPTDQIAMNSHLYRTLGLGYANLGALLMAEGYSYDSDAGRSLAGVITAVMHLQAYSQSARLAKIKGPFDPYPENADSMLRVMQRHVDAIVGIGPTCPPALRQAAEVLGQEALALGRAHGYRNAQVTVLAPTGTIGFLMDCDTTGIEPDIALVKYKLLAGGGMLKIVNQTVPMALRNLGYSEAQISEIIAYIEENDTIEGAPALKDEHLSVFDCAFKARNGTRSLHYNAHLRMMAAAQPFLSGAISKTVNMPKTATVEEIAETYLEGWKLGLKAVAIYRDGSKRSQPVNSGKDKKKKKAEEVGGPRRQRLPDTRQSITHKFEVAGHEGYLNVGLYPDGSPGEVFITMAKEGSTVGGLMDSFGTAVSICLQYGVPVEALNRKFMHARFEPSGFTKNPDIPIAKSLVDYIFRWLQLTFVEARETDVVPETMQTEKKPAEPSTRVDQQFEHFMDDAPACDVCGSITVRNGACYKCFNCGNSMGCS